jgi:hypothetical protein
VRLDRDAAGEREKLHAVAAGQVRDGADHPLAPQQRVRHRGDVAHVNAAADQCSALAQRAQRGGHQRTDRCEDDRGVELHGRRSIAVARPGSSELQCELLRTDIARAREGVDLLAMPPCDLRNDVCGGAEAIDAKPLRVPREAPRAIADQTRTQQWRGVCIVDLRRQLEAIAGVCDDVFRIAAIEVIAREARTVAEILLAAQAELALTARVAEPRHAEPGAERYAHSIALRDDFTDDLVARNQR